MQAVARMWRITAVVLLALSVFANSQDAFKRHMQTRNDLIKKELDMMVGSDIKLTDNEEKANEIIMTLKGAVMEEGFHTPFHFNFSKHFFDYKDEVKRTPLYKILRDMPKGALLHIHDTAFLLPEYVLNITYWDNLYVCFVEDNIDFQFSTTTPLRPCDTRWQLMRDARYSSGNIEKFDNNLLKHFTIVVDNPDDEYPDINAAWAKFQNYFIITGPLLTFKLAWEHYFYQTLKVSRDENIMYLEVRSVLPPLYDLEGKVYNSVDTALSYKKVTEEFVKDYPDFFGAKLIYAPQKKVNDDAISGYLETAREIKRLMPDFLAGFDLVGQEDLGRPLSEFIPQLTELAGEMDFIFHAGETSWYGSSSDENIFDAIILGTKRIGHGYAIMKHPALVEEIKKKDIALEVNVISNAVLGLVRDVRNHPLAIMLSQGLPVVLSSDDPGTWGADPITHDYYVAFLGVASRRADLKLLKKLAQNSLNYSTITNKDKVLHEFEIRWTRFIDKLLKDKW